MPAANASKAHIDPATGKLKETNEDDPQFTELLNGALPAPSPVSVVQHADGSISAVLGPEYMSFATARVAADGKLIQECATGPAKAAKILKQKNPKTARSAREAGNVR